MYCALIDELLRGRAVAARHRRAADLIHHKRLS